MLLRAVIDTNVFLSALWSRRGAAFEIFALLRRNRWQIVLSNHLLFEYEEIGKRNATEMELTLEDIDMFSTPSAPAPNSGNSNRIGFRA
jgi:predicted nucleic acid-binding protein